MSRLAGAVSAFAAVGGLAAGCGTSNSTPATSASLGSTGAKTTARSSATSQTSLPVNKQRAAEFAHAVNLTVADVPGATASARKEGHERAHCGGVGHEHELMSVGSPKFSRGAGLENEEITSSVTIMASAGLAARDIGSAQSATGRACYAGVLSKRFAGKRTRGGARFSHVDLSPLPMQAPGADASAAIRVTASLTPAGGEISIPVYIDHFAFTRGPAEINLQAVSAVQPEPATTEHQLLSLLLRRALMHQP